MAVLSLLTSSVKKNRQNEGNFLPAQLLQHQHGEEMESTSQRSQLGVFMAVNDTSSPAYRMVSSSNAVPWKGVKRKNTTSLSLCFQPRVCADHFLADEHLFTLAGVHIGEEARWVCRQIRERQPSGVLIPMLSMPGRQNVALCAPDYPPVQQGPPQKRNFVPSGNLAQSRGARPSLSRRRDPLPRHHSRLSPEPRSSFGKAVPLGLLSKCRKSTVLEMPSDTVGTSQCSESAVTLRTLQW